MEDITFIEISLPGRKGTVISKLSTEDYHQHHIGDYKWRLSRSGYAVRSWKHNSRVFTEYLHKRIFGKSCYHINGDRLDNRRINLMASSIEKEQNQLHFEIQNKNKDTPQNEPENDEGMGCITYSPDKIYAGRLEEKKPHGIGILTMNSDKQLLGMWENGNLKTGLIIKFSPDQIYSDMACMLCPPHPSSIEIVEGGFIVRTFKT